MTRPVRCAKSAAARPPPAARGTTVAPWAWTANKEGDAVLAGVRRPDLNDVFLEITGRALRDEAA